ncbi:MAG: hypothetical protein JSR33_00085 [Proteobacteria bacterium]|nr:hypothetical protein [Pseudomonadota bacterium]
MRATVLTEPYVKGMKDVSEGLILLGYALELDTKIQQPLILFLSLISIMDIYYERKKLKANPARTNQNIFEAAIPAVEHVMTMLLFTSEFISTSGKIPEKKLAQIVQRVYGMYLAARGVFDAKFHHDYYRIPAGIAGFVVGFMPNYSLLKKASLVVGAVGNFLRLPSHTTNRP